MEQNTLWSTSDQSSWYQRFYFPTPPFALLDRQEQLMAAKQSHDETMKSSRDVALNANQVGNLKGEQGFDVCCARGLHSFGKNDTIVNGIDCLVRDNADGVLLEDGTHASARDVLTGGVGVVGFWVRVRQLQPSPHCRPINRNGSVYEFITM